jgi:hypothetical protein
MIQQLRKGTRIDVHGATTELDPEFFGALPSVETAGVEFEDGDEHFGIPCKLRWRGWLGVKLFVHLPTSPTRT